MAPQVPSVQPAVVTAVAGVSTTRTFELGPGPIRIWAASLLAAAATPKKHHWELTHTVIPVAVVPAAQTRTVLVTASVPQPAPVVPQYQATVQLQQVPIPPPVQYQVVYQQPAQVQYQLPVYGSAQAPQAQAPQGQVGAVAPPPPAPNPTASSQAGR